MTTHRGYLRKPNRYPWRGIIRAALGKDVASWRYQFAVECRMTGQEARELTVRGTWQELFVGDEEVCMFVSDEEESGD